MIWNGPTWNCPHCKWVNAEIREICRNCGHDSNAGEFPYYNPQPPYEGREQNCTPTVGVDHGR
jgi:hypothetical protein